MTQIIPKIPLTTPAPFRPIQYPWAWNCWKIQQNVHWIYDEVPLGDDVSDWNKLDKKEINLISQIFRFFTQSDVEVNSNYMTKYAQYFKPTEILMMLSAFSNIETIHIAAYALLLETVGMPETEFSAFLEYKEMRDKYETMQKFNMDNPREVLKTIAAFGSFTEGLQLFGSFAILLNFPRFNKMKGMGQIVTWSVRDETLHCIGMTHLFHEYAAETGALDDSLREEIRDIARTTVSHEDAFIDLAFEMGGVEGLEAKDVKDYIRFVCDWRLEQLGLLPIYGIKKHPLPWLIEILNGVEHANFFEQRATEYSKNTTEGEWKKEGEGAWDNFDLFIQSRENQEQEEGV